jgi:hypothetical protein
VIQLTSPRGISVFGNLAASHSQAEVGTNWWPWLLFVVAGIISIALYYRMDSYRKRVLAEESLPQHGVDNLQGRLDHLPDRKDDYRVLCYRLARGSQSGRRALSDALDALDAERRTDA